MEGKDDLDQSTLSPLVILFINLTLFIYSFFTLFLTIYSLTISEAILCIEIATVIPVKKVHECYLFNV